MAKGLLGYMYTKGLHIDENLDLGIELLTSAAENGDLFSMDKLTDIHYDSDTEYVNGYHWENILIDKIEEEIAVKKPFAYYLKGRVFKIDIKNLPIFH
jgi:TPR repeat protein